MGKVGASPSGPEARSRRGEGVRSASQPEARCPTVGRRTLTHQHDGKSLLQFTWLRHRQLQRHVVRPEICLLRIHAPRVAHVGCTPGLGAAPGPSRPRRKSEQLRAAGSRPLARPARLPALRCAPATVQRAPLLSSAPSRAAPRPPSCSPPPQRRSGLFSSGGVVRAPGAYLHVAPLARRSQPAIADSRRVAPPTRSPPGAATTADTSSPRPPSTTLAPRAPRGDKCSSALPTQCPLSPGPRSGPSSAHSPRGLPGPVVSAQSVRKTKPRGSGGPRRVGTAGSKGNLYTSRDSYVTFEPLHSNKRNNHVVYIDSDT